MLMPVALAMLIPLAMVMPMPVTISIPIPIPTVAFLLLVAGGRRGLPRVARYVTIATHYFTCTLANT